MEEEKMKLWLVGQTKSIDGKVWEFQGIFDDKKKAEGACIHYNYFVVPVILNKKHPDETTNWSGLYYPYFSA